MTAHYDHTTADAIPVAPGSARQLALPRPGRAVTAAPIEAGIVLSHPSDPDSWWDGHITVEGTWLMGSEPDDVYPNDETDDSYTAVDDPPNMDVANILVSFPGIELSNVCVLAKTVGVELIGYASEPGLLRTAEGDVSYARGDAIVRSPKRSDRVWRIERAKFDKLYNVEGD